MGRQLRRVPLDFDWPINMPWKGFMNPYSPQNCKACDGTGASPEYKRLQDDWYDFEQTGRRWCDKLAQEEVDALVAEGRLVRLTSEWRGKDGWVKVRDVTAAQVNAAEKKGHVHDAINRWVACEARAKRLGITETKCRYCKGNGHLWPDEKYEALWDAFEGIEPPTGDGYQLWETVSEGSPITRVFAKPEELASWLVENDTSVTKNTSYEQWMKFICGDGWAPSMISDGNGMRSGVEAIADGMEAT